jgi:hypothetical protein
MPVLTPPRILAYSGFSPEEALKFWDETPKALCGKEPVPPITDAPPFPTSSDSATENGSTATRRPLTFFRGVTHDSDEERLKALTREIERWKVYAERHPVGSEHVGLKEWAGRLVRLGGGRTAEAEPAF